MRSNLQSYHDVIYVVSSILTQVFKTKGGFKTDSETTCFYEFHEIVYEIIFYDVEDNIVDFNKLVLYQ